MTTPKLEFLKNEGGEAEGLSDAGIETFRENPFAAVARETTQNSRDARDSPKTPLKMCFDVIPIPTNEFPSIQQFRDAARICCNKSKKSGEEKEIGFFENACRVLDENEIQILKISDFNTKGVRGPCTEGQPFHTLAKTDGKSVKENTGSGGSFGIGKNATFALSDIQTVFISTLYHDDNGVQQTLCMGKTQFISHVDEAGIARRRKGYWGNPDGYLPITNQEHLPEWLRREEQGTNIYSICMREKKTDWRYEMATAILMNFFCAIQRDEMEFEIDNSKLKINSHTIETLFNDAEVIRTAEILNEQGAFEEAKNLYKCLIDDASKSEVISISGLGNINMKILLQEGLGYTIGIARNGMYITNNLKYFNQPFKRFPLHRDFAVIIEPQGNEESTWFKRLENPRHDSLSADRITDPKLRAEGQKLFEKLAKEIRAFIRKHAKSKPSDSVELDELNDFFATNDQLNSDPGGTETKPGEQKATDPKPILPKPPPPPPADKPGTGPGTGTGTGTGPGTGPGTGTGTGPGTGAGTGTGPSTTHRSIHLVNDRVLLADRRKLSQRQIHLTAPCTGKIRLTSYASGLANPAQLNPIHTSLGTVSDGSIEVECTKNERMTIKVEFETGYGGPIELAAHEIITSGGAV